MQHAKSLAMSESSPPMSSHRPYLLRALYEWIADNDMTPHLLVDATHAGVKVPSHAVDDGRVVLNVAQRAVSHLEMGNDAIMFDARFGGVSQSVVVPVSAVLAIYARETGQGMALPEDVGGSAPGGRPGADPEGADASAPPTLSAVPGDAERREDDGDGDDDGPGTPGPRRTGHLRVVK